MKCIESNSDRTLSKDYIMDIPPKLVRFHLRTHKGSVFLFKTSCICLLYFQISRGFLSITFLLLYKKAKSILTVQCQCMLLLCVNTILVEFIHDVSLSQLWGCFRLCDILVRCCNMAF